MINNFIIGALYGIGISLSGGLLGNFVHGLVQLIKGGQNTDD